MSQLVGRASEEMEDSNDDGMLDGELAQLQLRYRVMQNSFHAYKEETKRKMAKQRMLIDRLELDHKELQTDLGKLETAQNKAKDERNVKKLTRLSKLEKDFQSLINEEKNRMKQIDAKTAEVERKIAEQRQNMGGMHNSTSKYISTQKRITVFENRLDKAMTLFNKQLATNASLRSEIDHLRQGRTVFDNLYKKLSQELEKSKREMAQVIHDSTEAFEQRDDARNKMMAIIERSDKDKEQHEVQIRDLQRIIHHDDRIRAFMGIKASDRAELKAEEAAKKQKMDAEKLASADQVTISQYEEAMKTLQEATGEQDVEAIMETFKKNEDENFALFNFVNELNNEIETLTEQVQAVKADINQFEMEDQTLDAIHCSMVRELEQNIDDICTDMERAEANLRRSAKTLDELMEGISGIFNRIGCDSGPILEMLDSEPGIKPKNVMVYMGQIEQRTTELLTALAYMHKQKAALEGELPPKPAQAEPKPLPGAMANVSVMPPSASVDEISDILESQQQHQDDEECHPLSHEELRRQVMAYLQTHQHALHSQATPTTVKVAAATTRDKKKTTK